MWRDYMEKRKYSVNFHGSFLPDLEHISRLLDIADNYDFLSKEEIFELTGIPTGKDSGKVEPHIMYANYMGLINVEKESTKYKLTKTKLGNIVCEEDAYIQEDVTKYLCHYFLTSKYFGADMWFEIFRKLPVYLGNEIAIEYVVSEVKKNFNIKSESILKLGPFNGTYNNENSLSSLGLITMGYEDSKNNRIKKYFFNRKQYDEELIYVYTYTLLKDLNMLDKSRKEFTVEEILNDILWNRAWGLDEDESMKVFEKLDEANLIKVNKQLSPITIIFNCSEYEVLNKMYSLLI